ELAQKLFTQALRQTPDDAKTRYLLARALYGAGDIAGARREIELACTLAPKQPEFLKFRDQLEAR
nr:tetratricopeptide repeat protein [Blastocatellia bacterium]